jgi:hypothetical protein
MELDFRKQMSKRRRIVQAATPEGQLAGEMLLEAIENQLRDNNPPEVSRTLSRLMNDGHSREDALRLIGYSSCGRSARISRSATECRSR